MSRPYTPHPRLDDCRVHGPGSGAELFLAEGESGAGAIAVLRNPSFQASLAMQGKPLNALRAPAGRVLENPLYRQLSLTLGMPLRDTGAIASDRWGNRAGDGAEAADPGLPASLRFDRVLLLFDPDADGIHIGALLLMFFSRWMRPLLAGGRVHMVRPPLYALEWVAGDSGEILSAHAYSEPHLRHLMGALTSAGAQQLRAHHYRGLGGIARETLRSTCIDPATRQSQVMRLDDAREAVAVFSPNQA